MSLLLAVLGLLACDAGSAKPGDSADPDVDLDGYAASEDCDDTRATVNPGEVETYYNGRDDDCDDETVDDDQDGDGSVLAKDCDDEDPASAPGFSEVCDGADNNCDGHVDEGVSTTYFLDADGDDYGNSAWSTTACDAPDGYARNASDCDDTDPDVNPGAPERCDGEDQDCDGDVDEGVTVTWYTDADEDGYGDPALGRAVCERPAGTVLDGTDCDDTHDDVHPGAAERCNGADDDCDGNVDPATSIDAPTWYVDDDGDGYGGATPIAACDAPAGTSATSTDCDDTDGNVHPGATEVCNGVDDDCDGWTDPPGSGGEGAWYADADGDGYGDALVVSTACDAPTGYVSSGADCDDTDASVFPGATEVCNGVDDDCDGSTDPASSADASTWYDDLDGDGEGDPAAGAVSCDAPAGTVASGDDCDDTDASVFPGASEVCNGVDDDCDGSTDPASSADAGDWYDDADGDGYGDPTTGVTACDAPAGFVASSGDCDDATAAVNPGASEVCNGVDDDCDGAADPSTSADASTWYPDADTDGYGFTPSGLDSCSQPSGYVAAAGDCNDFDANISPMATEVCDGDDNDCDGSTDEDDADDAPTWYRDADGDGFGDASSTTTACDSAPTGYVADEDDCDDSAATVFPGSHGTETPGDGIDTDCDGYDGCDDANCDGYPDVLLVSYYDGDYSVDSYLYAGDGGSFSTSSRTTLSGYGSWDSLATDLDQDGYQDLVLANYYSGSTRQVNSHVYWGSASGFSASDRLSLPTLGALGVAAGDFDNDGYNDLVFANHHNDSTYATYSYVYWGSAAGWSSSDRTALDTLGALRVLAEDLDQDGYDDLVFCNYYSGSSHSTNSYVYWGSSAGYSTSDRSSLATIGCYDVAIGDVNDDGYTDVAFANYYSGSTYSNNSYVYYGSSSGYSAAYRASLPTTGTIGVEVADLDDDGYDDVTYGGYYGGSWSTTTYTYVYWGSALGLSSSVYDALATSCGIRDPVARDLDDDGYPELVLPRHYSGSSYTTSSSVWWNSAGSFSSTDTTSLASYGTTGVAVGDLDADGWPELVFNSYYGPSSYSGTAYVYWGSSAGYSSSDRSSIVSVGALAEPVLVGETEW